jgi:hypothetical protein
MPSRLQGLQGPQTAKQQIAKLPIQVPPKEHFSLDNTNISHIVYRGKSWYAKGRRQTNCSHGWYMVKRTEMAAHSFARANKVTRTLRPKSEGWTAALFIMTRVLESQLQARLNLSWSKQLRAQRQIHLESLLFERCKAMMARGRNTALRPRERGARNWQQGSLSRSAANLHSA